MRRTILTIGLTTCMAAGLARPLVAPLLAAQSLGDLARQEEERRKTIKTPAKVITNKDLDAVPDLPPPPGEPATSPASKAADASKDSVKADGDKTKEAAKEGAKDADKAPDKSPVRDQAYWSGRLKDLQTALERDQSYLDAMQSRINALTTDFANRDDPAQRAVIERDRQKAVADFDRLQAAIVADKKALADFDEEARRAGVPPGWLR